jgi:acyl-[acyl carrier protein]--UDP-N-acetylglucosamine O-acyltransferase
MASIPQVPEIEDQDLVYYLEQINLYLASQQPGANVVLTTTDNANFSGGYLNRYLAIAYANSASGLDFGNTDTNRAYFATFNTDSNVWSSNPADYVYFEVNQGFGTTRNLYYQILGGRQIAFNISNTTPNNYVQVAAGVPIDLDGSVVGANGANGFSVFSAEIFRNSNTTPATPTGGTYTFATGNLVPPAGWSVQPGVPNVGEVPYVSTVFFNTTTANVPVAPSGNYSVPIQVATGIAGANGAPGANGAAGANGFSVFSSEIYISANAAPATPTGGTYTFSTGNLVPPTGWSATVPAGNISNQAYVSTATFTTTTPNTAVGPSGAWSTPQVIAVGAPGERGFIPMGFVQTASDPNVFNSSQLTLSFAAPTSNTVAPIGTGFSPITGDTAAFAFANITRVATYDASTSTWSNVTGQIIPGNVIATGSITSRAVSTTDVFAVRIQSTNANIGNITSAGFWLDSTTGNARFGGNLLVGDTAQIGNNLLIGNNANIGGNARIANDLVVGDDAAIGDFLIVGNSATIRNSLIIGNNAIIGTSLAIGNNLTVGANANIGGNLRIGDTANIGNSLVIGTGLQVGVNANIGGNLRIGDTANIGNNANIGGSLRIGNNAVIGNNLSIGGNLSVFGLITGNTLNSNTVNTTQIIANAVSEEFTGVLANNFTFANARAENAMLNLVVPVVQNDPAVFVISYNALVLGNVQWNATTSNYYYPMQMNFFVKCVYSNNTSALNALQSYDWMPYAEKNDSGGTYQITAPFQTSWSVPFTLGAQGPGGTTANVILYANVSPDPDFSMAANSMTVYAGSSFNIRKVKR